MRKDDPVIDLRAIDRKASILVDVLQSMKKLSATGDDRIEAIFMELADLSSHLAQELGEDVGRIILTSSQAQAA